MATGVPLSNRTLLKNCAATVAIGDLVYLDTTSDATVIKAVDNNSPSPVMGVVKSKPTATTCKVQVDGKYKIAIDEGILFVSLTGTMQLGIPASGHRQRIGFSGGDGTVWLEFNKTRIRRG